MTARFHHGCGRWLAWFVPAIAGCPAQTAVDSGAYLCTVQSDCAWGWVCQKRANGAARCVSQASAGARACQGTPPACDRQDGVCAGSQQLCGGAVGWLDCQDEDYQAFAAAHEGPFETVERSCDGRDNNCDGHVDEAAQCCQSQCEGRRCGADDGCGQPCQTGSCGVNASCLLGRCECDVLACGTNCCAAGQLCRDKACCEPVCGSRVCGPDPVCGGSCGSCAGGQRCDASGGCGPSWAVSVGGTGLDAALGLALTSKGESVVVGGFQDTVKFGDKTLVADGVLDGYLMRGGFDGEIQRVTHIKGTGYELVSGVAVDDGGTSFVVGDFDGELVVGEKRVVPRGDLDAYVARVEVDGTISWLTALGGDGLDSGRAIAMDLEGNVYVAGVFGSTEAQFGRFKRTPKGALDVFVAKLDSSGTVQWVRTAGGPNTDDAKGIAVDQAGDVYVVGYFGEAAQFDTEQLEAVEVDDGFVAKIAGDDGAVQWAVSCGADGADVVAGIAVDGHGHSYVTGSISGVEGRCGGEPFEGVGMHDVLVAKLDPAGGVDWVRIYGGTDSDAGAAIAVDGVGRLYVTGLFEGQAVFGDWVVSSAGKTDTFVIGMSTSTVVDWAIRAGGSGLDEGTGVVVDAARNVYVAAAFEDSALFWPSELRSAGSNDLVLWSFTTPGKGSDP